MHNQLKSGLFIALFLCTMGVSYAAEAVSYTHLTLPTNREV